MADVGLTPILMRLAATPAGCHSSHPDLAPFTPQQIGNQAKKLVHDGKLHLAKISHRNVRYFTDKALAEQCERNAKITSRAPKFGHADNALRKREMTVEPGVTYSPDFKFTACPGWQPMFQAFDMPVSVYGGNQRGRVLVQPEGDA